MAIFNKYDQFAVDLATGVHDFTTANSLLRICLSDTAPVPATDVDLASVTQIAYTNLTTASNDAVIPTDTFNVGSETPAGTYDVLGADIVFDAGGAVATFRYVILYNDTITTPTADRLIGWWDYGVGGVTLANGESFTVNFGAQMFTIT